MWIITTITHPLTNISQRVVWCEETKCTVMTEEQMDMLNDNFIVAFNSIIEIYQ